jgi:hypothetical protein
MIAPHNKRKNINPSGFLIIVSVAIDISIQDQANTGSAKNSLIYF